MNAPSAAEALLSPGELAELDRLRRHLSLRTATDGQGSRLSRRRGQSPEFVDHRAYSPGDDPRRLDWNVFARTDQAVIKRYRAEEESAVRIAIDASPSMHFGDPDKLTLARKLAAAIGYLALVEGERTQVGAVGRTHVEWSTSNRGRGRFGFLARTILGIEAEAASTDATTVESRVAELLKRAGRAGTLVLIGDAIDPTGDLDAWPRAIRRSRSLGHDVRMVQILAPEEIDPPWEGDLSLVDAEDDRVVDVTFDASARREYAARLEALVNALREACRSAKATYVRARSDEGAVAIVRRLAAGGIE
ncbi:MAG: DUF58 domain-containing protein [Polyangiales bacterium]